MEYLYSISHLDTLVIDAYSHSVVLIFFLLDSDMCSKEKFQKKEHVFDAPCFLLCSYFFVLAC